jgi:hypothetical protein
VMTNNRTEKEFWRPEPDSKYPVLQLQTRTGESMRQEWGKKRELSTSSSGTFSRRCAICFH